MPLSPGTRLGPYEIVAPLGAGGMGEVYRATDTNLKRQVAIKVLPQTVGADPERLARFQREAEVLATLNHPNIAHIHGLEKSDGALALVMELVGGPTLADRIAKGAMPIDEALPIATQVAEALEAAHEQGIIHRDLKPANIKVRSDGTVKVLDFGLAKAMEPTSAMSPHVSQSPTITTPAMMTGVGVMLGTAAYMAPEQAKGRTADKRSDLWAFGCVVYEMLTGRRAFEGEDVSDTLATVLKSEPDWALLPSDTPPAIRILIERCLAKDRRQRIGDIAAAQFALAEASRFPGSNAASPVAPNVAKPLWKRAVPLTATLLLASTLVSAGVWWFRLSPPATRVTRFSIMLPAGQEFTSVLRAVFAISPDGTKLVYAANNRLFLRPFSDFESRAISGTESTSGVRMPVFSPDGRSIAFHVQAEAAIKRVAVSGGSAVTICRTELPQSMSWSSSNDIVFVLGRGVFRCALGAGTPEQLAHFNEDEAVAGAQILPGGKTLLFTLAKVADGPTRWDKARVVVETLGSGQRKTLIEGGSVVGFV